MAQVRIVPAGYGQQSAPQSWREIVKELQTNLNQWNQDEPLATPLEKRAMQRALSEYRAQHAQAVLSGALAEYEEKITAYRGAGQRFAEERKREVARFNPDRLLSEMRLAEQLVTNALRTEHRGFSLIPGEVGELEEMYQESMASGDLHKQRGTCETVRAALAGFIAGGAPLELRAEANRLSKRADKDLRALRITPELAEAYKAREEAGDALLATKEELLSIGSLMDGVSARDAFSTSPYTKAAKRVKALRTGEIQIFEPTDSEVTGVYIKPEAVRND